MPSLKDLLPGSTPPSPTGLFQTRITRTPGGIAPVADGTVGAYDPAVDPQKIAASAAGLTPQERQTLAQQWSGLGKGFITAPLDVVANRPDIMRHEQLHDLQQKAHLGQYANQIAAQVEPGVVDQIKASPVYQEQAKRMGMTPTIADEGSVMQLVTLGRKNTPLQDLITSKLNPDQKKQLSRLIER